MDALLDIFASLSSVFGIFDDMFNGLFDFVLGAQAITNLSS